MRNKDISDYFGRLIDKDGLVTAGLMFYGEGKKDVNLNRAFKRIYGEWKTFHGFYDTTQELTAHTNRIETLTIVEEDGPPSFGIVMNTNAVRKGPLRYEMKVTVDVEHIDQATDFLEVLLDKDGAMRPVKMISPGDVMSFQPKEPIKWAGAEKE